MQIKYLKKKAKITWFSDTAASKNQSFTNQRRKKTTIFIDAKQNQMFFWFDLSLTTYRIEKLAADHYNWNFAPF